MAGSPEPIELAPFDLEAEACVIATGLVEPHCIPTMASIIAPEDFFRERNKWTWEAMLSVGRREGWEMVNQMTVGHELRRNGRLDDVGGVIYLSQLVNELPTTVGCEYYAEIVRRDATYRAMITASSQIRTMAMAGGPRLEESLSRAITLMEAVAKRSIRRGPQAVKRILEDWLDRPPLPGMGVLTGWPSLNELAVLRPGGLYIVAARPSRGKSSFLVQLLHDVAIVGRKKVLLFSLEMGRGDLMTRMLACHTGINSKRLERRLWNEEEERKVNEASGEVADIEGAIQDRTYEIGQIEVEAKAHALKHGLDLLAIDYLQLVTETGTSKRYEVVTNVSRRLKALAVDLEVPVVALSQLNRSSEGRADHRPQLHDLRESGSIEQDADCVIFLHDGEGTIQPQSHNVDVLVDKQRMGQVGKVVLRFYPATCQFTDRRGP